jgi:hypothetical protein
MPLNSEQLRDMDRRSVIVVTHDGAVISVGVLRLSVAAAGDPTPRLDLHFETEAVRCVMRVPVPRVEELANSWDGDMYRYVLPPADRVWQSEAETLEPRPPARPPRLEAFAFPRASSPGASLRAAKPATR